MSEMKKISFFVPDDLYKEIQRKAELWAEKGKSFSKGMRKIINQSIKTQKYERGK